MEDKCSFCNWGLCIASVYIYTLMYLTPKGHQDTHVESTSWRRADESYWLSHALLHALHWELFALKMLFSMSNLSKYILVPIPKTREELWEVKEGVLFFQTQREMIRVPSNLKEYVIRHNSTIYSRPTKKLMGPHAKWQSKIKFQGVNGRALNDITWWCSTSR